MSKKWKIVLLIGLVASFSVGGWLVFYKPKPLLTVHLQGQLGNQLFQIAAAYSYSRDNGYRFALSDRCAKSTAWDLKQNQMHVYHRIPIKKLDDFNWDQYYQDPLDSPFTSIPSFVKGQSVELQGYFESEKYFISHKQEILKLFAPTKKISSYLKKNYPFIFSKHPTVALHVRTYYPDWMTTKKDHPQITAEHFYKTLAPVDIQFIQQALAYFPQDALIVVFSDSIPWCKKNLSHLHQNMIFIEKEPAYHDFYLMSFCDHQIFAPSTFGWWSAYLNSNPHKTIIVREISNRRAYMDKLIPEGWIRLKGTPNPPPLHFEE